MIDSSWNQNVQSQMLRVMQKKGRIYLEIKYKNFITLWHLLLVQIVYLLNNPMVR